MVDSPSDQELMRRVRRQDQAALATLYQQYGTQVYSLAYRVVRHTHLAEEVAQDTFLKVWRLADQWDSGKGQLSSWILTIARNTAIDRLRSEQRQPTSGSAPLEYIPDVVSSIGLPHDAGRMNSQLLLDLMRQLPPDQAEAIELAFFQGLTHSQLAERLGLPLGTVKTRVRLGLQKLRGLWLEATKESR